ncbi:MAG: XRE family transcriptional regulator [Flavobacterium sp.]|nr:MAG: XRE family transcriptional regulator [Flavobacterium sp.]
MLLNFIKEVAKLYFYCYFLLKLYKIFVGTKLCTYYFCLITDISLMNISELNVYKEKLGERIRSLREKKELSVRAFALIADIEHHQLINIEKGRVDVRYSTIIKLATAFEIQPKDLLSF